MESFERVQWGSERCWRQIKADGDADKTVRERQRLLSSTPCPRITHTHTVCIYFQLAVSGTQSCAAVRVAHQHICKDTFTSKTCQIIFYNYRHVQGYTPPPHLDVVTSLFTTPLTHTLCFLKGVGSPLSPTLLPMEQGQRSSV